MLFSIGLVVNEHRAAESMLPLSLFQIPAVAACMAVGFLTALRLFGAITYLPLLLRIGFDTNAAGGGLLFLRSWQPWWPRRRLRDARSAKPSDT